jgi:uncharacterized protein
MLLSRGLIAPIRIYQRYLSPLKSTPTCRYVPTCSQYAAEAIEQRGAALGLLMSISRIVRCNPLFHGGYHPVRHLDGHSDDCNRMKGH